MAALRSLDQAESRGAWEEAASLLWEAGMYVANSQLCGSNHLEDRKDIVNQALQEVYRWTVEPDKKSFNQKAEWGDCLRIMRRIVRFRVASLFRSQGRKLEDAVEELPDVPDQDAHEDPRLTPEELWKEVARLDPDLRLAIEERFHQGYSTDEIASRHGINRNTLLSRFSAAFKRLRERLTGLEGGGDTP